MWGRRQLFVWQSSMTSMPRWWKIRVSWTLWGISSLTQTPWLAFFYFILLIYLGLHLFVPNQIKLFKFHSWNAVFYKLDRHPTGCCQRSCCFVWDQRVSPQQQFAGPESPEHQQATDGPQRMHRVGTDFHPRLPVQLQPQGWPRGSEVEILESLKGTYCPKFIFCSFLYFSLGFCCFWK